MHQTCFWNYAVFLLCSLNIDQEKTLRGCVAMIQNPSEPGQDIVLVHGVFGSGKSYFVAVLILCLIRLFDESDTHAGIEV